MLHARFSVLRLGRQIGSNVNRRWVKTKATLGRTINAATAKNGSTKAAGEREKEKEREREGGRRVELVEGVGNRSLKTNDTNLQHNDAPLSGCKPASLPASLSLSISLSISLSLSLYASVCGHAQLNTIVVSSQSC